MAPSSIGSKRRLGFTMGLRHRPGAIGEVDTPYAGPRLASVFVTGTDTGHHSQLERKDEMEKGSIKHVSPRGFFFIQPDAPGEPDVFGHVSQLTGGEALEDLAPGDKMTYTTSPSRKPGRLEGHNIVVQAVH
jgi:cold shock CspA family protein